MARNHCDNPEKEEIIGLMSKKTTFVIVNH
jgi:hypothetical protein